MQLVQSASSLFIWAATTCRFIREGKHFAVRRLEMIIRNNSNTTNALRKHLDQIYITVSMAPWFTQYTVNYIFT
jgi:hypothetical protein